jgi:hypothetical protein
LHAAQLEPQADAGAAARNVVLQITVKPFETGVDVRRQGDQE